MKIGVFQIWKSNKTLQAQERTKSRAFIQQVRKSKRMAYIETQETILQSSWKVWLKTVFFIFSLFYFFENVVGFIQKMPYYSQPFQLVQVPFLPICDTRIRFDAGLMRGGFRRPAGVRRGI